MRRKAKEYDARAAIKDIGTAIAQIMDNARDVKPDIGTGGQHFIYCLLKGNNGLVVGDGLYWLDSTATASGSKLPIATNHTLSFPYLSTNRLTKDDGASHVYGP